MVEEMLRDWVHAGKNRRAVCLRYFNPVGAHASGLIGEKPDGVPDNLMPLIALASIGKLDQLKILGCDYDTRDGTGERDFIHVCDLAIGHTKAVEKIEELERFQVLNLGTGSGTTVKEMIATFEAVSGVKIPTVNCARRMGDVARSWADVSRARGCLEFECQRSLEDMCRDVWNWTVNQHDLR